jgi:phenylacetate-CoA ligase
MSLIPFVKARLTTLPFPLGAAIARVPYQFYPFVGRAYRQRLKEIQWFRTANEEQQRSFIFSRVKNLVEHAATNVEFYKRHYAKHEFDAFGLRSFESLEKIPLVCKGDLQQFELRDRSTENQGKRFPVNTGGSTGKPLSLYVQNDAVGHERAHISTIWSKFGFAQSDYTLVFSGRSKFKSRPIQYDSMRHCFNVDIYQPFESICDELRRLCMKRKFKFLHGYPSAIHEFALYCATQDVEFRDLLTSTIRGGFLGSEFPQKVWRDNIEQTFAVPSVSFYGHTERCVLAYEMDEPYKFDVLQSYGYAEAVDAQTSAELVGTSYYNFACPMIRYKTGDEIGNVQKAGGILKSFEITTGRQGDFVLDRNGKKIPLTGLIFGRHHRLFDFCSHLQIGQAKPGKATVYYCPIPQREMEIVPDRMFDSSNVSIDFSFVAVSEPIKTRAGKVRLLVDACTENDF